MRAPHALPRAFDRGVGGATAAFLAGLARAEIWGSRDEGGRVSVPPRDDEALVPVGQAGTVTAWSWVAAPTPDHPLARPFAYALIRLDGADMALLHIVDPGSGDRPAIGLRVTAEWREERHGSILDIRAFVPGSPAPPVPGEAPEQLHVATLGALDYTFEPGTVLSQFYEALGQGRIDGGRCPSCATVYVPPHPRCPVCGAGPMTTVAVADTGTVESVTVVHLPAPGLDMDVPFAWARIVLDGADVSFPHVLEGDVRVGQRVEAVWAPEGSRPQSWEAITRFRPTAT